MLGLLLASEVGLVDLDRPLERPLVHLEPAPDVVSQVPRALLRDAQVAVYLHGGRALDAGRQIAGKLGDDLTKGTWSSIMKQARVEKE